MKLNFFLHTEMCNCLLEQHSKTVSNKYWGRPCVCVHVCICICVCVGGCTQACVCASTRVRVETVTETERKVLPYLMLGFCAECPGRCLQGESSHPAQQCLAAWPWVEWGQLCTHTVVGALSLSGHRLSSRLIWF